MKVTSYFKEEIAILTLNGRLDASQTQKLRDEFKQLNKEKHDFIFDFSDLEFIDSTGLGMIITCLKSILENKRRLVIVGMNSKVRMVFEITRAHKIFEIFDDMQAAIDFLKK